MRLLLTLFTMLFLLVLTVAVIVAISYGLGRYLYTRQSVLPSSEDTDACAQCNADRQWYETLPVWKKSAIMAWWLANRYMWATKGCK